MLKKQVLIPFQKSRHNHRHCVVTALRDAEYTCQRMGLRLTHTRKRVLELLWQQHTPVKAYDILQMMHRENPRAAPATVYRALEFLQQAGLVHRIESLNAFVGCGDPSRPHDGQFFICRQCGAVAEIHEPKISRLLQEQARLLGFQSDHPLVEIQGRCPRCCEN